ncbi:hypothetical protein C1H46_002556 [Malus baccata]|uniref:Uncharacterized protein n=1 Tax=Malus baccata TaxID=106549 RepID=A0A540NLL1_MALBA|nr:hypothetical protein C1H46_002556 [Malus baccata]
MNSGEPQLHQTTTSFLELPLSLLCKHRAHQRPHFPAKHHHKTTTTHRSAQDTQGRPFTVQSVRVLASGRSNGPFRKQGHCLVLNQPSKDSLSFPSPFLAVARREYAFI